jgi:hypothetical protein
MQTINLFEWYHFFESHNVAEILLMLTLSTNQSINHVIDIKSNRNIVYFSLLKLWSTTYRLHLLKLVIE